MSSKPEVEFVFEKMAAPFILNAFSNVNKRCGICGDKIVAKNLGGIVKMGDAPSFICDNTCCLLLWAEATKCGDN